MGNVFTNLTEYYNSYYQYITDKTSQNNNDMSNINIKIQPNTEIIIKLNEILSTENKSDEEYIILPKQTPDISIVPPTEDSVPPTEDSVTPTEDPVTPTEDPVPTTEAPVPPTEDPVPPTEDPVPMTEDSVLMNEVPYETTMVEPFTISEDDDKSLYDDEMEVETEKKEINKDIVDIVKIVDIDAIINIKPEETDEWI
jgi:hypothetical protein